MIEINGDIVNIIMNQCDNIIDYLKLKRERKYEGL
jgi:hypothetical protein